MWAGRNSPGTCSEFKKAKYDYAKLERLKHYRTILPNRLGRKYGME